MLIGLNGRARSGKDTVCGYIKASSPNAKREAFADRLKLSAARVFMPDCTLEEAVEWANEIKGDFHTVELTFGPEVGGGYQRCTGREYLQRYGTEAHREIFGESFWVDVVLPPDLNHAEEFIVVTDVRFDNEAQRVRDLGGEIWKVIRPEVVIEESVHASEVPIDSSLVDKLIVNDGSLDDLQVEVMRALGLVTS